VIITTVRHEEHRFPTKYEYSGGHHEEVSSRVQEFWEIRLQADLYEDAPHEEHQSTAETTTAVITTKKLFASGTNPRGGQLQS